MSKKKDCNNLKIVVTGGPSAGKTTVTEILAREFREKIAVVPEAASILFKGGLPRGEDVPDRVFQQRAIYFLQSELENYVCHKNPGKIVVCDRGSLDGAAYWPLRSGTSLFKSLKTTEKMEIARYDWVIHLDTANAPDYVSAGVRREGYGEAQAINKKILKAWSRHPNQVVIHNSQDFSKKMNAAIDIVMMILSGRNCQEIQKHLE